eukprot:scaffold213_cov245-Pinguiococcus_pyrenoidosus.AAC.40
MCIGHALLRRWQDAQLLFELAKHGQRQLRVLLQRQERVRRVGRSAELRPGHQRRDAAVQTLLPTVRASRWSFFSIRQLRRHHAARAKPGNGCLRQRRAYQRRARAIQKNLRQVLGVVVVVRRLLGGGDGPVQYAFEEAELRRGQDAALHLEHQRVQGRRTSRRRHCRRLQQRRKVAERQDGRQSMVEPAKEAPATQDFHRADVPSREETQLPNKLPRDAKHLGRLEVEGAELPAILREAAVVRRLDEHSVHLWRPAVVRAERLKA